jgi:nickel superoxide dismutase
VKKGLSFTGLILGMMFFSVSVAFSHCQIPCGIYDDEARFSMLNEDVVTIEKSISEITKLSAEGQKNFNQIVRWVNNKEEHANKIMELASNYFLAQRVPPGDAKDQDYLKKLVLLHQMIVYSMKLKQTTDLVYIEKIKETIKSFHEVYSVKK